MHTSYSILPPESAFCETGAVGGYVNMQCGPHHSAPVTPGLLASAVQPRVANPGREAPLGPFELGEICPNCIFGNVDHNA